MATSRSSNPPGPAEPKGVETGGHHAQEQVRAPHEKRSTNQGACINTQQLSQFSRTKVTSCFLNPQQ